MVRGERTGCLNGTWAIVFMSNHVTIRGLDMEVLSAPMRSTSLYNREIRQTSQPLPQQIPISVPVPRNALTDGMKSMRCSAGRSEV